MKKLMAVVDQEELYGQRMLHYFNNKEQFPFETILFTNVDEVKEYVKQQKIDLLLLNQDCDAEELTNEIGQIILLSDQYASSVGRFPLIYRFQSADNILREVLRHYEANTPDSLPALPKVAACVKLVGVYSPIRRCLKTSFALTYGLLLARSERVLYLNLDSFSGFEALMNQKFAADLSDVMFYQQQGSLAGRLAGMVYTVGQMDYIPPVRCSEDLWSMDWTLFMESLHTLMESALYDTIVLDMGEAFGRPEVLLQLCHLVYMPVKEDLISQCRLAEFEDTMRLKGYELLLEKVQKLVLPYCHGLERKQFYVEQLLWGELGDYVRTLLKA